MNTYILEELLDFFITLAILMSAFYIGIFLRKAKDRYCSEFKIVLSEGAYDIMLGSRRLTTKPTFDEAKKWLDEHKDDYRGKDKVLYREKL